MRIDTVETFSRLCLMLTTAELIKKARKAYRAGDRWALDCMAVAFRLKRAGGVL